MLEDWYEVWADDGLPQPYLLVMTGTAACGVVIRDPQEGRKVVYQAPDYESAELWLLEDEYRRVQGRMTID